MKRAAAVVAAVLVLSGCSQVAAIAPVGGSHIAEVRFAALDILVQQNVDVKTAPVCESNDGAVSCLGETLDGKAITVTAPADDLTVFSIMVGDDTLYDGSIMDVLDDAARRSS